MDIEGLRDAGIHVARLYTRKEAAALVARLDADDTAWKPSRVKDYSNEEGSAIRTQDRLAEGNGLSGHLDLVGEFDRRVRTRLLPGLLRSYGGNVEAVSEFNAVRYPPGGMYRLHVDNGPGLEHRQYTVVCYLNDDVDGGATDFPYVGVHAQPKAGMAIAFPSEYPHAALPVEAGIKRVLVCWMIGPPPVRWI